MARAPHEHAQPQNVAFKAAAPDPLFEEPAPAPKVDWLDMPEPPEPGKYGAYPYDHQYVLLTSDGVSQTEAQWRTTREIDRKLGRWVMVGFWTARNSGGRRIGFEPLGYRRIEE